MQIAVVGCGWLGLPLASHLQVSGHSIVATCRSESKALELNQLGFTAQRFELGDDLNSAFLTKLFACDVLILNIPVGRKNPKSEGYLQHMQGLLEYAAASQIQNLLLISTTSVYGDNSGIYTEQSPTAPSTQSAQINLALEGLTRKYFAGHSTIIRPAGLVGKDRHPANYLAGKKELGTPDNVVNLIHQDDVINAIEQVLEKNLWGHTLHLSATEHPTRADYYTWAAEQLGLELPDFLPGNSVITGKQIDASKSLELLNLTLKYPSPFDML